MSKEDKVPVEAVAARPVDFKGKVWVIDDDRYILSWLKTVLEQQNVDVRAFSSPLEASSIPWDSGVTLVFIDMRMPQMSGTELCEKLREKAGPEVRFVACTAMALPEERVGIREAGFDEILMKPVRKAELLRVMMDLPLKTADETGEDDGRPLSTGNGASGWEDLDISNLISLTMGDEQLLKDSLEQFVEDTLKDLSKVEEYVGNEDNRLHLRELFHRLAGRTAQIGAGELGGRMRQLELELAGNGAIDPGEIEAVVKSGYGVVEEIQEKYVS